MSKISIVSNNRSIRLRFTFEGKRHSVNTSGTYGDAVAMGKAELLSRRIALDIADGSFDCTLARYQPLKSRKPGKVSQTEQRHVTPTLALAPSPNAITAPKLKRPLALTPAPAPVALLPASVETAIAQPTAPTIKAAPSIEPRAIAKLPANALNKTELIIQIQSRSPRKVPGIWKMRRDDLDELYAAI